MTTSLRILTTSTLDSFPSLLLINPDGSKVLVNCGEGCQRSFLESSSSSSASSASALASSFEKGPTGAIGGETGRISGGGVAAPIQGGLRVRSVARVCLTTLGHEGVGGLPGLVLTAADAAEIRTGNAAAAYVAERVSESPVSGGGEGEGTRPARRGTKRRIGETARWSASSLSRSADVTSPGPQGRLDSELRYDDATNNGEKGHFVSPRNGEGDDPLPGIDIIGPPGTAAFLHSLRHFMRRDKFRVSCREGPYEDTSHPILRRRGGGGGVGGGGGEDKKRGKKWRKKEEGEDEGRRGFRIRSIPILHRVKVGGGQPSEEVPVCSFVLTAPPQQGKFLREKAREMGIPPGPIYGRLKRGNTVTYTHAETGEECTARPEDVLEEGTPGSAVVVACVPDLEVLDGLRGDRSLEELRRRAEDSAVARRGDGDREKDDGNPVLEVVVHIAPASVFHSPPYKRWMESFGLYVTHITLLTMEDFQGGNEELDGTPFRSAASGAMSRSAVHPDIFLSPFPPLGDKEEERVAVAGTGDGGEERAGDELSPAKDATAAVLPNVVRGRPLLEYVLAPRSRRGINTATVLPAHHTGGVSRKERAEAERAARNSGAVDLSRDIAARACAEGHGDRGRGDSSGSGSGLGELLFTGTGSALPCKHRNVTGKYLCMDNGNAVLLDVGEGTTGQLLRAWKHQDGREEESTSQRRDTIVRRLRGITAAWVSHPHADHHLGLLRFLAERQLLCDGPDHEPLVLMAPPSLFQFLSEYAAVEPRIRGSYVAVDCRDMIGGRAPEPHCPLIADRLRRDLGLSMCVSVPVSHCPHSYAVVLDGTSFGRVAYSGDCRPSSQFAEAGQGADLLIHESTFEDGMEEEAVLKRHSTVGEALEVGRKMGARAVALTHFSQRYPRIPPLKSRSGGSGDAAEDVPVLFAFDFMRLRPGTIGLAASLTPALRLLCPDDDSGGAGNEADVIMEVPPDQGPKAKDLFAVPGIFAAKGIL